MIAPIPLSTVSPSELEIALKWNKLTHLLARFRLEKDGLKLASVIDAEGQPVNNDGVNIGKSLLPK